MRAGLKRVLGAAGRLPLLSPVIRIPALRAVLERVPGAKSMYGNEWDRIHPFDKLHGTDTSGWVSSSELPEDERSRDHAVFYAGSQPSVVRAALQSLPALESFTFLDLGCGKGRVLAIASELPFKAIQGIELSPHLASIARRNAAIVKARHPQRTPIQVAVADAATYAVPAGDLVVFMYHPFGPEVVARVAAGVEAALRDGERTVYVVYYNPVAGHFFDGSKTFQRRYARMLDYARDERGYGPDQADAVIIWQGGRAPPPPQVAPARITNVENERVVLQP